MSDPPQKIISGTLRERDRDQRRERRALKEQEKSSDEASALSNHHDASANSAQQALDVLPGNFVSGEDSVGKVEHLSQLVRRYRHGALVEVQVEPQGAHGSSRRANMTFSF